MAEGLLNELRRVVSAYETYARCLDTGTTWGDNADSDAVWFRTEAQRLREVIDLATGESSSARCERCGDELICPSGLFGHEVIPEPSA